MLLKILQCPGQSRITKGHLVQNVNNVNMRNSGINNTMLIVTGNTKVVSWVSSRKKE